VENLPIIPPYPNVLVCAAAEQRSATAYDVEVCFYVQTVVAGQPVFNYVGSARVPEIPVEPPRLTRDARLDFVPQGIGWSRGRGGWCQCYAAQIVYSGDTNTNNN